MGGRKEYEVMERTGGGYELLNEGARRFTMTPSVFSN